MQEQEAVRPPEQVHPRSGFYFKDGDADILKRLVQYRYLNPLISKSSRGAISFPSVDASGSLYHVGTWNDSRFHWSAMPLLGVHPMASFINSQGNSADLYSSIGQKGHVVGFQ